MTTALLLKTLSFLNIQIDHMREFQIIFKQSFPLLPLPEANNIPKEDTRSGGTIITKPNHFIRSYHALAAHEQ
jgi:hypothetical protein